MESMLYYIDPKRNTSNASHKVLYTLQKLAAKIMNCGILRTHNKQSEAEPVKPWKIKTDINKNKRSPNHSQQVPVAETRRIQLRSKK